MTDTPGLDDAIEAAARAWLEPAARASFSMESFRGTYPAAAVGRAVEAAAMVLVAATREAVAQEIAAGERRSLQAMRDVELAGTGSSYRTGHHDAYLSMLNSVRHPLTGCNLLPEEH